MGLALAANTSIPNFETQRSPNGEMDLKQNHLFTIHHNVAKIYLFI